MASKLVEELQAGFPDAIAGIQSTNDEFPTVWLNSRSAHEVLSYLKLQCEMPFRMLYDLTAIDERLRENNSGLPESDFTVVYHLLSYERNQDLRIKVPLTGDTPSANTVTDIWPNADWYEREAWDLFGIDFRGHPDLRRILMPPGWKGHPLRKDHPGRATEMGRFELPEAKAVAEEKDLQFRPADFGINMTKGDRDYMFLNFGPQHPGTHGVFRIILGLDGEEIAEAFLDIGYHHRAAEKIAERQTWHTFIPYTDRVDYLGGVTNNFPYVLAVEKLAGINVPDRAKVIRIMLAELFRISSHLVWYGTFAQDVGAMTPVFFTFNDRERLFQIVEAITGGRMHPSWFRIGGVAQDLPDGWEKLVGDFIAYLPSRLDEYDKLVMQNPIFIGRTKGVGAYTKEEAVDWGVTGPGLRACGYKWDVRKFRPYSGYDQMEFDIPTATHGDCYDRGVVRIEEMRQSLRIIEQCVKEMPPGPYKAAHPMAVPPIKERTMHDIETLINHFLGVSWGPVIPPGEAFVSTEGTKGNYGYYLIADGNIMPYRARIRSASFPHLQIIPRLSKGTSVADLIALLGSIDFVMGDVDR